MKNNENTTTTRNYGIDLLRFVLMFMICTLHTLGHGGILYNSAPASMNYKIYWIIEIFAMCAVDSFAFISGYVATNKPRKQEKLVDLWFQAFFYSFIITISLTIIGVGDYLGKREILKCALPITFNKFWYITSYFALFFAIPVLNKFIFDCSEKTAKKMFIGSFIIYSCIGFISNSFDSSIGYSAIWLMVLYFMGALAKKIKLFEEKKSMTLITIWIISMTITWVLRVCFEYNEIISYLSPTILLNGIIMVILFSRIKLKGTMISKITPLALGIYLFQLNPIIWESILKDAFLFVVNKNIGIGLIYVFFISSLIFISGLLVEGIRRLIFKVLKLSLLSKKIIEITHIAIDKLFIILH